MNKIKGTVMFLLFMGLFGSAGWANPYAHYRVIVERNVFKPLGDVQSSNKTNEEELKKAALEEEKRQAELKKEEERKQLESKKRELESSLSLSGVVFDGKKLYALISDRQSGQGGTYVEGDLLKEAKVAAIDENTQTVVLDYQGKFKLTLKIGSR